MKNNFKLYLIFLFIAYSSSGQSKIVGYTKDLSKIIIPNASILLTDSIKKNIISYSFSNNKGLFIFEIPSTSSKYSLKVSALGFKPKFFNLDSLRLINDTLQLQLSDETIHLKEVKVIAKSNAIVEKNDTTSYIVKKFVNGSESVVEDVLKKLPGIQISEDGGISYYGKKIDKVLIEGDDMFKSNHRILTKNLGANTLDKVQIIDNYSENNLLKGINNSNESVMNLTILDSLRSKPNINITLGLGISDIRDIGYNLLNINKKNKIFIAGNNNNMGKDNSQYSLEKIDNESFGDIENPVNFEIEVPNLKLNRYNFNNSTFNSINNSYSFNKKINLKTSFLQYNDIVAINKQTYTIFQIPDNLLEINEFQATNKKPTFLEGQINFDFKINTKTTLKYALKYKDENVTIRQNLITSSGNFDELALNKSNKLFNSINFTRKLRENVAITLNGSYSDIYISQNYQLNASNNNQQSSNHISKKTTLDFHILGVNSHNNIKYDINGGVVSNSTLLGIKLDRLFTENISFETSNQERYSSSRYFLQNSYTYFNSKVNITGELGLNLRQIYFVKLSQNTKYLTSKFSFNYKISSLNKISFFYSNNQTLPEITEMYPSYYLTNYRTFVRGGSVQEFKNKLLLINYIHSDFFNQQLFYVNIIGVFNNKSFGKTYEINRLYTLLNNSVVDGSKNLQFNLNYSFFIPLIASTISVKSNISRNYFDNLIDNNLRHNISNSLIPDINVKYLYRKWLNVEIGSTYYLTKININNTSTNYNFSSINYIYINTIFKKLRANFKIEKSVFSKTIPSIKNYFADVEIAYPIKKNKLELKLIGSNLTNNNSYKLYSVSDFATTNNQYSILPRRIIFYCNFRF